MRLQTNVETDASEWKLMPSSHIIVLGSCFAEKIGEYFSSMSLSCVSNPFGVLYNPLSILQILDIAKGACYVPNMLYDERRKLWFDYNTDTELEHPDKNTALKMICNAFAELKEQFDNADVVIVTFGTNHVYLSDGRVVSNCHKQPSGSFVEKTVEVADIVSAWDNMVKQYPNKKFVFTVSPIRYEKYGFHESQLSKAALLLSVDSIIRQNVNCSYFPAYEIMNDELRDYRFYAEDMIHPSAQAVSYIIERFGDMFFGNQLYDYIKEYTKIAKSLNHRPLHPETEEYKDFLRQIVVKINQLKKKYPYFAFNKELNICHTLLNK